MKTRMKNKKNTLIFTVILASLLLASCTSGLSGSSWPGISTNGDKVYIANSTFVYAVNSSTGTELWRYPDKASRVMYFAAPVLVSDQLIVGDYTKTLHSLNPSSGAELWSFQANGPWIATPLVVGETIFAPNGDGNLYALDLNGNLLWKFKADRAMWSHPVGNGNTVYQAALDHKLYAVDMISGQQKWVTDLGGAVVYSPTLSEDGIIYLATLSRELFAINSENGEIQWRRKFEESLWSQPVLSGSQIFLGDLSNNAYALNAVDGSNIWTQKLSGPVTGQPTVTENAVIFATEDGTLVATTHDGERLWSKTVEGKLYTGPIPMDDKLIIGVALGETPIIMINSDGQDIWSFVPAK